MMNMSSLYKGQKLARSYIRHYSFMAVLLIVSGLCSRCVTSEDSLPAVEPVHHVNLDKYLGTWYEIARYPHDKQEGCYATTAEYSKNEDGTIRVLNRCRLHSFTGEEKVAEGRARVVDEKSNAKLKVSFFWPFSGDYWIIALGDKYEYAAIGHPERKYLWILSRTPQMNESVYHELLQYLEGQYYDLRKLQQTPQPAK